MTNPSAAMIGKRTATLLAWFSLALCVIASTMVVRLVRTSDVSAGVSAVGNGLYYFLALPLAFSIAGTAASHRNSIGPMWAAIGGLFGCVLVGALSVGRFFAPAAIALLAAGAAHLVAERPRWCALIIPLWIAVGLFAIPVVSLGAAVMQRLIGGGVIFNDAIHIADKLYLTIIKGNFAGDAYFPTFDEFKKKTFEQKGTSGEYEYTFVDLEK